MAEGYALALQDGLVAALRADPGISALVGKRVYDEPPKAVTRPFICLGGIEPRPLRTSGRRAADVVFSIEAHSRPQAAGRVEATRIAASIVAALDEQESAVTVAGYTLIRLQWMGQTVARDSDGESYSAIIAFEALIDG